MGEQVTITHSDPQELRVFMKALLTDVLALEQMISSGMIEDGVRRIGAEQEMFLIDKALRPAPVNIELLERIDDPAFTTELAQFNLEANLSPLEFHSDCLSRLEADLNRRIEQARAAADPLGVDILLTGILPTLGKSDLSIDNMTPRERYAVLNDALMHLRGGAFEFRVTGTDELIILHESVMLEACNTSCQVHFQVSSDDFARFYNIAQAVTAPVLAAAVNSPILFGRRLWAETRIALFQQAVDTRAPGPELQERSARVSFGSSWVQKSALEIFRDDIARFRVVMGVPVEEEPLEVLAEGGVPRLGALQLHNGTVYRWNRPCYGVLNGKPHLRIENRALPAGPTVLDEVANAAFWFGLIAYIAKRYEDITQVMDFDVAKGNFMAAAREGLNAQFVWCEERVWSARELISKELLPHAREGLAGCDINSADIDRYLGVIEKRVETGQTGSQWAIDSLVRMKDQGTMGQRMRAVTGCMLANQQQGSPVHEWPPARYVDAGGWKENYLQVKQYMTTDLFTVHEDEVIDLVANLMDWRHIRHVPVEDHAHKLVGLVSYRSLLRFLAQDLPHGKDNPVPVSAIMHRNPITVSPETTTLEAIELMRREKVACLPVVKDGQLLGIVTERDFMNVAAQLMEMHLREP